MTKGQKTASGAMKPAFRDGKGRYCSLHKSEDGDHLIIGLDDQLLTVETPGKPGKKLVSAIPLNMPAGWEVKTKMTLTRKNIRQLMPLFRKFIETGEIE